MKENTFDNKTLSIRGRLTENGLSIFVKQKEFKIEYPKKIWQTTPLKIRHMLLENIVFANTNFLPLMLNKEKIKYDIKLPLLESFLFKNEFFDLLSCEKDDNAKHLSYLRKFYNLEFEFAQGDSSFIDKKEIQSFKTDSKKVILPFTSGKESLLTFGICKELGIDPVLFYCQEPVQPYEEKFKLKRLNEFSKHFKVTNYFVKNGPGLFRYGVAFNKKKRTEIGWGVQTTILALLALPFVYKEKAKYIFFGSEFSNNDYELQNGWKKYYSYDQTSFWTLQQSNMIRLLTNNQTFVKSILEPIDQINIFFILKNRYPHLLKYLFSCFAENPLYKKSQWCHQCYKCYKLYTFALACQLDPSKLGFKKDLTKEKNFLKEHFKKPEDKDIDFALYILYRRGFQGNFIDNFKKYRLKKIKSWSWYKKNFTILKSHQNLPVPFRQKILKIFREELSNFSKTLP